MVSSPAPPSLSIGSPDLDPTGGLVHANIRSPVVELIADIRNVPSEVLAIGPVRFFAQSCGHPQER